MRKCLALSLVYLPHHPFLPRSLLQMSWSLQAQTICTSHVHRKFIMCYKDQGRVLSHSMSRPLKNPIQSGTKILEIGNAVVIAFSFWGAVTIFLRKKMDVGNYGTVRGIFFRGIWKQLEKNGITSGRQCGFAKSKWSKWIEFPVFDELADPIKSQRHRISWF